MKLNKGDTVLYRDLKKDRLEHDVVEKAVDNAEGKTVVLLKNGDTCRLPDIIEVNNGQPPVEWAWG